MNLKEAIIKFDFEDVSILIIDNNGKLIAVSEVNSSGGYCSCCCDGAVDDKCTVVRVVDLSFIKVLYERDDQPA